MSQLVLPHTIDAGTEVTAVEHQANYVAIRDTINGNLEGGASGNLKANGITARELDDAFVWDITGGRQMQEGVFAAGDYKVTPGAGLQLSWAAGTAVIVDDSAVVAPFMLLQSYHPVGSSVTIAANASGNPRIDQVILTATGYRQSAVSVLQGTATVGATLDNRSGAATLPNNAIRLADILMPNGFSGPFVLSTNIRDRRPWARGLHYHHVGDNTGVYTAASGALTPITSTFARVEVTQPTVLVEFTGHATVNSAGAVFVVQLLLDGVQQTQAAQTTHVNSGNIHPFLYRALLSVTPGSHSIQMTGNSTAGTWTIYNTTGYMPHYRIVEVMQQNASNTAP